MFDTYTAAVTVERELVLTRAERTAPLLEAARRSGSAPVVVRAEQVERHWSSLARAVQQLRWVLRLTHA